MSGRAACVGALSLLVACGHAERPTERSADENAALGGEIAAQVGAESIPLSVIERVASAQQITAAEAARKVVDDAIAASGARAGQRDQRRPTSWLLVAARARLAADELARQARALGPPTDDEVRRLSALHWVEVDRPPTVRVMHAIVLLPKNAALLGAARALAGELHATLASASNDDFEARARALPHDAKLEMRVERLPAFTEDGRVAEGGGAMDAVFSKAAYALPTPGATSSVVESPFGFHVIRLLERIPEKRMPFDNRRLAFTEETHVMRARDRMDARVRELRARTPIVVEPAAEQLMRTIEIGRDHTGTP